MKKVYNEFATGDGCVTVYGRNVDHTFYVVRQFAYEDHEALMKYIRATLFAWVPIGEPVKYGSFRVFPKRKHVLNYTDNPNKVVCNFKHHGCRTIGITIIPHHISYEEFIVANDRGVIFSVDSLVGFYNTINSRPSRWPWVPGSKCGNGRGDGEVLAVKHEVIANESLSVEEEDIKVRAGRKAIVRKILDEGKWDWRARDWRTHVSWKDATKRKHQWREK